MKLAEAQAEARAIEAAGSEKALGENEAARKRALLIAVESDAGYHVALEEQTLAETHKALAQADLEALQNRIKLYRAFAHANTD